MKRSLPALLLLACWCSLLASAVVLPPQYPVPAPTSETTILRSVADEARCRQWVDSVMQGMSLKERLGQLLVYTLDPSMDKENLSLLRKVVNQYHVGGLLFSGGLLANQAKVTNEAQRLSDVPLLITFDGEWGLSMRLKGTPVFPKNRVLGCIRDNQLLYEYGKEMARQYRELGVQVNFGPVVDVDVNPRNPVINVRSFGADPVNVAEKAMAYARGLEEGGVMAVAKHFPGHGDTETDSHKTLPLVPHSRQRLDSIELYPFRQAIRSGMSGMMVGHLEVPALESRRAWPSSLSSNVIDGLLVKELGFRGLVFTDALSMKGVSGQPNTCLQALKAGNDLLLVPRRIQEQVEAILTAIKKGDLPEEVVNEKCRKVLTYKYALGLSQKPSVQLSGLGSRINAPQARDLIRRLNQAAVTVLSNPTQLLPLDRSLSEVALLTLGDAQSLRPLVETLRTYTHPVEIALSKTASAYALEQARKQLATCKRVLVAVADRRLTEYRSLLSKLSLPASTTYLLFIPSKDCAQLKGALARAGAVVLAHSADADVQRHVARLLYGDASADGRLSAPIGDLFAAGTGVTLSADGPRRYLPEDYGLDPLRLARIDTIAQEGIAQGAYPGCQVVVWKDGHEVYNHTFGRVTQEGRPVSPTDVYDLASLTKTTATLLAVMKLYDKGLISLTDYASQYVPQLKGTNKERITLQDLLYHQSGLPPTILYYEEAIDPDSYQGTLFRSKPDKLHPLKVNGPAWVNPNFRFRAGITSPVRTETHTIPVTDSLWVATDFRQVYLQKIIDAPLKDRRYRYSCTGFILLQKVVESITGEPLNVYLQREFYAPMGLQRTGYLPLQFVPKEEIVPSSHDRFLRKQVLQGYVHDEAAAFQGGVSGNAGLFSNASEVACVYQMLLNGGEWEGRRYLSRETCRRFTTSVSALSRRGLGFDKPDKRRPESSPCAACVPGSVFGHTGFTGTCAWADPDNGLVYVFLSNRIYPNVWSPQLSRLEIRPRIQEAIYQALVKP